MNDKNNTLDTETRATSQDHHTLRLWLRLQACSNLIQGQIRSRLRSQFDITLPRYDLMAQLERSPKGLRMGELSKRMMVTGGNITGITDQLVAEGLVVREGNPEDRRAYIVKFTPQGHEAFAKMAIIYEKWVIEFFDGMKEMDRYQLHSLLATLKAHMKTISSAKSSPTV
ncbi:MarR family transcriptional regulator [Georgfuchsia toluolica]|uniref:MarR family transcriptional regulator n=1 Tax=Georgfuchsia toluolica TaxID=424218 RepID=A0A916J6T5_9PROT|nr:MarR family transcriptional regulator [Georgfuchsia toluolica]CAG4885286.1 MarR family transcriptional regulator [Georgfuchsia toluolica]